MDVNAIYLIKQQGVKRSCLSLANKCDIDIDNDSNRIKYLFDKMWLWLNKYVPLLYIGICFVIVTGTTD